MLNQKNEKTPMRNLLSLLINSRNATTELFLFKKNKKKMENRLVIGVLYVGSFGISKVLSCGTFKMVTQVYLEGSLENGFAYVVNFIGRGC